MTGGGGRLYFLDNMRSLVIVGVVFSHTALCYMRDPPSWWYVIDAASGKPSSWFYSVVSVLNDASLMPCMFFVAGYFAWSSLSRKGALCFLREKAIRLGVPWLLGIATLGPMTAYVARASRREPVGFIRFAARDFWTTHFDQSVFWFLLVLLAFFAVLALFFRLGSAEWRSRPARTIQPAAWQFTVLIAVLSVACMLVGWLMQAWFLIPPAQVFDRHVRLAYLFVIQPPRLPVYVAYFAMGIYAWRRNWFRPGGYAPRLDRWAFGYGLALLAYLGSRARIGRGSEEVHAVAVAITYNLFCLTALIAGIAACRRFLAGSGRIWRELAADSFGIYFVHLCAVCYLAWGLRGWSGPALLKSLIVFSVALAGSWAFTAYVLRRAPGLRRIF